MNTYRFFALDGTGRVDRGFERRLGSDAAAIDFARMFGDAPMVEVFLGQDIVARIEARNGNIAVLEPC